MAAVRSYAEHRAGCTNAAARRLLDIVERKRTNLCVAADVERMSVLLELAERVGPYACALKTHIDIVEDFAEDSGRRLAAVAAAQDLLLFEDRKFADIGSTARRQYAGGVHRIADWAHIIDAHAVPGPGLIAGLRDVGLPRGAGLLLLAEMSSAGSLATVRRRPRARCHARRAAVHRHACTRRPAQGAYTEATVRMARDYADFVIGFVCGRRLVDDAPSLLHFAPGVSLDSSADALGQRYRTPAEAVAAGADIVIVGRGIYGAPDPAAAAARYRDSAWAAYEARLQGRA